VSERAYVDGAAITEGVDRLTEIVAVVGGHLFVAVEFRRQDIDDVGGGHWQDVHDFEPGGGVAEQSMGTRDVACGQHEMIRAGGERRHEVAQHVPQAGEALERTQLEHFVDEESAGLAAGSARAVEEREQGIKGLAGRGPVRHGIVPGKR